MATEHPYKGYRIFINKSREIGEPQPFRWHIAPEGGHREFGSGELGNGKAVSREMALAHAKDKVNSLKDGD